VAPSLAIALRKAAPQLAVYTTASPESAQRNLYGPPAANGKARVLVYEAKLDRLVRKAVAEHEGGDADAGTVIVVGHNQPGFIDFVRQQGNDKAFQGRDVVLLTCGDDASNMPGVVEDILNNFGAVSVTDFNQAIRQQLLPPLVDGITSRLTQPPAGSLREGAHRKDQTMDSVLRATIEEIRSRKDRQDSGDPAKKGGDTKPLPASVTPNDIDALEFHNESVYRQGKPGHFLVQAAPVGVIMRGGRIPSGVAGHSILRLAA
jgi:hypothetical protein